MQYNDYQDIKVSALGMGCMRLPQASETYADIDQAQVDAMVDYAFDHGVNYFDTAYGYHDGQSEVALGRALARHERSSFYLADKFPGYDLANMPKVREIFEEQLARTGAGYFDFYLFHNVCEINIDAYLDPQYGILDYLLEQKAAGRIRHLGFSVHGSFDVMERFLVAYGEHMEFAQVQLNYMDWNFQDARAKVEDLRKRNLPIIVMEPVRGGKLATLSESDAAALAQIRANETPAAMALRFCQDTPGVFVTLSGMSNMEQLEQNIATFQTEAHLSENEYAQLIGLGDAMAAAGALPCTACRYCTAHCPQGLDIPRLIELYNEHTVTGGGFLAPMAIAAMPADAKPSACIGCGSCEAVCPQQLPIAETMAKFAETLGL